MFHKECTPEFLNGISKNHFPGFVGITITSVVENKMTAEMKVGEKLFAPNGFLHAGSIVTFADSIAGYSTIAHLPEGGKSFTTIELKSNFMRAKREGTLECESTPEHLGRTTQVWRVIVRDKETQKKVAVFSCTQMILYLSLIHI